MAKAVIICLAILGGVALIGGIVAFLAFRRAPHGYEDAEGFHRNGNSKV